MYKSESGAFIVDNDDGCGIAFNQPFLLKRKVKILFLFIPQTENFRFASFNNNDLNNFSGAPISDGNTGIKKSLIQMVIIKKQKIITCLSY